MTDPDATPYDRYSMFVIPRETPGINVLRNVGLGYQPLGGGREGYVRFEDVRVPADHMLGPRGRGLRGCPDSVGRRAHPPRDADRRARPGGSST